MNRYTLAGVLAALAAVLALAVPAAAVPTAAAGTDPPICHLIPASLQNAHGGQSTAWFQWCGDGPDGPSPAKWWVRQFIGDGFTFNASQCPRANPCTMFGTAAAIEPAPVVQAFTATTSGTPATSPTNGTLYIYDNVTAQNPTRSVEYYMHDGYDKTALLTNSQHPQGVILKSEDIENNCGDTGNPGAINPVGGTGIRCTAALHTAQPAPYPVTGDLLGRYCRVPPPGATGTCPFLRQVTETATGTGPYLTVGGKDHGALLEVEYYTYVGSQEYDVQVTLPVPVLVTRIVLQPTTATAPSAVLVFG